MSYSNTSFTDQVILSCCTGTIFLCQRLIRHLNISETETIRQIYYTNKQNCQILKLKQIKQNDYYINQGPWDGNVIERR